MVHNILKMREPFIYRSSRVFAAKVKNYSKIHFFCKSLFLFEFSYFSFFHCNYQRKRFTQITNVKRFLKFNGFIARKKDFKKQIFKILDIFFRVLNSVVLYILLVWFLFYFLVVARVLQFIFSNHPFKSGFN